MEEHWLLLAVVASRTSRVGSNLKILPRWVEGCTETQIDCLFLLHETKAVQKTYRSDARNLVVVPPGLLLFWIDFLRMAWKTLMIPRVVDIDDDEAKRTWNAGSGCQCPWRRLMVTIRILPCAVARDQVLCVVPVGQRFVGDLRSLLPPL